MTSGHINASTLARRVALAVWVSLAGGAQAQVALPGARVDLPGVDLVVPGVSVPTDLRNVRIDARQLRVRELLRQHPDRLTTNRSGELVVRREPLAQPSNADVMRLWEDAGFTVIREQTFAELGLVLYVLEPPRGRSLARGLRDLRKLDPDGTYDYQHVMTGGGASARDSDAGERAATKLAASSKVDRNGTPGSTVSTPAAATTPSQSALRIGMIDAGVDSTHTALQGVDWSRRGCAGATVASPHGTAVASLLVAVLREAGGSAATRIHVAAADAFCGDPTGGAAGTLIDALAWMVNEQVSVINFSLVGPRNALLERAVASVIARGQIIVAAVGNDGPAAPPLYPAAYEGVIGVTAVDRRGRVLLEACRGKAVDFAALGTDVQAAALPAGFAAVRGTSFASPQVAALLASRMPRIDPVAARSAFDALATSALDLGASGRDDVYGLGWVMSSATEAPTSTSRVSPPAY
ncbi:MAG: S8 family serine peptidase [Proteobacteria bacterium]|nr:S8 family serine peptidase [Pseudomonadota bacterium]